MGVTMNTKTIKTNDSQSEEHEDVSHGATKTNGGPFDGGMRSRPPREARASRKTSQGENVAGLFVGSLAPREPPSAVRRTAVISL